MEQELKEIMKDLSSQLDEIKVEIAKANERKLKGTTFNCAALKRARKSLINLEKTGFKFRRISVDYQKSVKND